VEISLDGGQGHHDGPHAAAADGGQQDGHG
jgi:hypothetical protein